MESWSSGYDTPRPDGKATTQHDKSGLRAETWKLYIEQAIKQEEEYLKACNMEMDTMLLFATLFSGVLTAFVIESYPSLEADTGDVAVQLLQQILVTLQANSTAPPTETIHVDQFFQPDSSAVRVNSYWFAALVVSISTAFLTILAKQWLFSLSRGLASTEEMMGRQQQYRHDNLSVWRLAPILLALPVLLHISLLLFLIGLVEFLLPINKTVATVTGCLAAATILFYAITHIVSLVRPACPYRTSVTNFILAGINSILREVTADWWSIKTVIEIRLPCSSDHGFGRCPQRAWRPTTTLSALSDTQACGEGRTRLGGRKSSQGYSRRSTGRTSTSRAMQRR